MTMLTHLHSNGSEGKLDLIIESEKTRRFSSVRTIPVGYSNHRLVVATLECARPVISPSDNRLTEPALIKPQRSLKSFACLTASEVERLIKSAPMKTLPVDRLPISVVKSCSVEFSAIIVAYIANISFQAGRFPSTWKAGQMALILKKPGLNTNDFKSFKPITNLTTLSKLLERLTLARLKPHVVTSPNYSPLQSAYRVALSTETALVKIVDDILSIVDSGSAVALVSLDISATFDTISHRKLLAKLEHDFSIEGVALEWINSYLSKQTFFMSVGRSSSAVAQMCSGVSQGSVLEPILFTAYVSPIGRLIELYGVSYHKYADNTQLYTDLTANPNACIDRLESCSAGLQQWFCENNILLNSDKSKVCFFSTRQKLRHANKPSSIEVTGCCIDMCEKLKTLGVTLDSALTFEDGVVRSCNFHISALCHIRRHLTREVANTVAGRIVGARIDYCNSFFYSASEMYLDKLQRLQNKLAHIVSNTGARLPLC